MSTIAKLTANKIAFDITMGNDVQKYIRVVNNFYKVKQISEEERNDLLELIDSAKDLEQ